LGFAPISEINDASKFINKDNDTIFYRDKFLTVHVF